MISHKISIFNKLRKIPFKKKVIISAIVVIILMIGTVCATQYVEKIQISTKAFKIGMKYFNDKNYLNSLTAFKTVIREDSKNYKIAIQKITESRSLYDIEMINEAQHSASKQKFDLAMGFIENALDIDSTNKQLIDLFDRYHSSKSIKHKLVISTHPKAKVDLVTQLAKRMVVKTPVLQRNIVGIETDLGVGTFQGGKDIQIGLYDITSINGNGIFTVIAGGGALRSNEVLGNAQNLGISKVRVNIQNGDEITLAGIDKVHFQPVTTPIITTVHTVNMYSGSWVVGEDIAAGRYMATTSGSGNFVLNTIEGIPDINEILGGNSGVRNITVDLTDGEIIDISGIRQVMLTPVK